MLSDFVELIRGLHNLHSASRGSIATLGSFDGVHLGHQAVIKRVIECGQRLNMPATIITTEPLPREFFTPDTAPPRLTRFRERLEIFAELGIERVLCLTFNKKLADMPAADFVQTVLMDGLGVRHLVIGDDTRFGKDRQGDFTLLQDMGRQCGFTVEKTPTLNLDTSRISSTRIRSALNNGDMEAAQRMLGRYYHMSGRVAHGDKRGRVLGYPTANIHLRRRQTPIMGIFAVEIEGLTARRLPGVASVGIRPTFGGGQCVLEVHLFDFDRDIYGHHVRVYFLHKLRDEKRFETVAALVGQIRIDEQQARDFFRAKLC